MQLRTVLLAVAAVLASSALAAAAALVALAGLNRSTAEYIVESVQSVEAAQSLRLHLGHFATDPTPELRATIGAEVARLRVLIQSAEEEQAVVELETAVAPLLRGDRSEESITQSERAATRVLEINVKQAHAAEAQATLTAQTAQRGAYASGSLLLLLALAAVLWMRARVLHPLRELRGRIARLAAGDPAGPRSADVPLELREIEDTIDSLDQAIRTRNRERIGLISRIAASLVPSLQRIESGATPLLRTGEAGQRLAREITLVRRVLAEFAEAARFESDDVPLERTQFDLVELAEDSVRLFEQLLPLHRFELVPHAPLLIDADRRLLSFALNHAIVLAVHHDRGPTHVRVSCEQQGGSASLTISSVPGDRRSFGEVFEAVRESPERMIGVPGAALSTDAVRKIVLRHGGTYERVASRGVSWMLAIPAVPSAAEQAPQR